MTIGKRIKGARFFADYGAGRAAAFARDAGVSKQYLNNLESGRVKKPDPNEILKIARLAGVDMEWIIDGGDTPPSQDTHLFI